MKKIILLFALTILAFACSKDDEKGATTEFSGSFQGLFTNYDIPADARGSVVVKSDGKITIELLSGRLQGTAQKTEDGYSIAVTKTTGIFQNINNLSGTLSTSSEVLSIDGTNLDGSPVTITGQVVVQTTGGWENLAKTAVYFTHNENNLLASVTINRETFSGLNKHYEGGYCNPSYSGMKNFYFNYDDGDVSQIFCNTGTLEGMDGNPVPFTDCSVICFILDKETHYNYTVEWSNGATSSGEFTTGGGGSNIPVCLSSGNGGGNGGGSGSGSTQFTLNGISHHVSCYSLPNDCQGISIESSEDNDDELYFNSMPQSSSGTFQFTNALTAGSCDLTGFFYVDSTDDEYYIQSGTLTKTGANKFTFTCRVFHEDNTNQTYTITGSGTYQ